MYRIIYYFITLITRLHAKVLSINDNHGLDLTDKQLHFLIIGIFGFAMLLVIQPVFKWLIKHHAELMITFLYVFTIVVVISFAIEIGQAYSGTGDMDFYDIASGILGFFVFFGIYLIGYLAFNGVRNSISKSN
ncbi:MAG: hypothetical protein IJ136_02170 [Erysipelotrichaceae bacterium]|jgi:hypothetical protein|nr:hypothetical protein [Erysipelotrichaceae bacterium]MBQ1347685.1 hypothetical protein [Erysipelotrichaceae bacterium]MBQ1380369.1 hypothetical protein [Erysipelotrichaceae bacterium]MBQ1741154.1 hypothetical protein [Erysipelotrichaceae bacterium]MBQ1774735.1 hypothetical protein [Erysipelotrichaceae bacterium]